MHCIAIAGQAQNGKDCLSDFLQICLNNRRSENYWQRTAFAKAVKQIFMDTFGKDVEYIEKWKLKPEIPPDLDETVRKALQFIGDGFRKIKATIWIDLTFRDKSPKIISDARYPNELQAVKNYGGYTVLVVNPRKINDDPNGSEAQMRVFAEYAMFLHRVRGFRQFKADIWPSIVLDGPTQPEGWEHVDYVIINDDTIEDFHARIEQHLVPLIEAFFKEAA